MLRSPQALHPYQRRGVEHILAHRESMLWYDCGMGKTVTTLTAIAHLLDCFEIRGCLVVAPLRVVQLVWGAECARWEHLQHLECSIIHGKVMTRTRSLRRTADIFLVNYEGLPWLVNELINTYLSQGRPLPFDMVVYDEVTRVKSARVREGAKRTEDFMKEILPHLKRRVGLTGTPLPNGYTDLFGQYLMVDDGKRLGRGITAFRDRWFESDYMGYKYNVTAKGRDDIKTLISDITIELNKKDYLDLPPVMGGLKEPLEIVVDLPAKARLQYEKMERDMFLELDSGAEKEIFGKASLSNACLQFANGALYVGEPGENIWEVVHDAKLDALEELVDEAGTPILLAYNFRHDAARIKKRLGDKVVHFHGGVKRKEAMEINRAFNAGELQVLMGHPACVHPSTEVLTEYHGWLKIIDVLKSDRVFDGVEFVEHGGCSCSGVKAVKGVFGIKMTSEHKLLINGEWVKAANVKDDTETRRDARYCFREADVHGGSGMCYLRKNLEVSSSEFRKTQQVKKTTLHALHRGHVPQHDRNPDMADMAGNEEPGEVGKREELQTLRRTRDRYLRGMVGLQTILRRYVRRLCRRSNHRKKRCERELLQRKLHMGAGIRSTGKQAYYAPIDVQRGKYALGGVVSEDKFESQRFDRAFESGNDCGRSCSERKSLDVSKEQEISKVYDLVNCGPRNRFLIRNADGEVFTSHNSIGHGQNFQYGCHTEAFFGLPWSLELYEQFYARVLERQGQTRPGFVHFIMARATLDYAVLAALQGKSADQSGLRAAINAYRRAKYAPDP